MDVTCPRCNTRYEFDEALVSSRGTTVKCTSCSHQFKVYRPKGAAELDGWTIRTVDGRELRYDAMRKLQAAITNGEITQDDVLIPGDGGEPRRLAKIEELQSFFRSADAEQPTMRHRRSSAPPVPEPTPSLAITRVAGGSSSAASSPGQDRDGEPLPTRSGNTLRPPSGPVPPDPKTLPRGALGARDRLPSDAPTMVEESSSEDSRQSPLRDTDSIPYNDDLTNPRRPRPRKTPPLPARSAEAPSIRDDDTIDDPESVLDATPSGRPAGPGPAARAPEESEYPFDAPESSGRDVSIAPLTPTPSAGRPSILRRSEAYGEPRFTSYGPRADERPGLARWVVGIIAVGVLGVGGFALFNRYANPKPTAATATPTDDRRVDAFLSEGDKALAAGDIEAAKDEYIKASGLAENDARVSRSLARIEIIRADQLWLYVRLLEEGSPHRTSLEQQLERAVSRASSATEKAAAAAPDDPLTVGLQIDVLRLQGKREEARKLVEALDGAGPDGGRALALLDLLEEEPNYSSVIDRLRTATRTEHKLGRAHALLVYALAKAGRAEEAQRELEALESENPRHPLNAPLRAWVTGSEIPAPEPEETADPDPPSAPGPRRAPRTPPPEVVEPFATAEPDLHDIPGTKPPPEPSPPEPTNDSPPPEPPPETPPEPTPPPPPTAPPIDTSDLPPE